MAIAVGRFDLVFWTVAVAWAFFAGLGGAYFVLRALRARRLRRENDARSRRTLRAIDRAMRRDEFDGRAAHQ